eukprot:5445713-Pyramimonas_sp.AAC.1
MWTHRSERAPAKLLLLVTSCIALVAWNGGVEAHILGPDATSWRNFSHGWHNEWRRHTNGVGYSAEEQDFDGSNGPHPNIHRMNTVITHEDGGKAHVKYHLHT